MSRYVTVSSIGAAPLLTDNNESSKDIVDKMKRHWNEELSQVLVDCPDIIVLPEACDRPRGISLDKRFEYYQERQEQMLQFFQLKAKENSCYIAYSGARQLADGTWRNSTQLIDRNGEIQGIYNKNYPTIDETDDGKILPGVDSPIFECDFGRVACAICFDLHFDELRLRYVKQKPELILFSSMMHGGLAANIWAYSCRSYVIGAIAGLQNYIISPLGEMVAHNTNYHNFLTREINLDYKLVFLDYNWAALKAMKEKYGRKVHIDDPGYMGAVLISCEADEYTIDDILKEFGIELLDDYWKRSIEHRNKNVAKSDRL